MSHFPRLPETDAEIPAEIDVCVCTFRRPSVAECIASIAPQLGPGRRLIVCDNDETDSARAVVRAAGATAGVAVHYVHAPARNISIARNACLDSAGARFIAFIDDDETALPGWLDELARCAAASGADVVFGPVEARFGSQAPGWAVAADMHSLRPTMVSGAVTNGYSANVLIRRAAIGDLRFDLAYGRSGGEDSVFFHQAARRGCRLAYAPAARTEEPVPASRTRLGWLLRRSFRAGQTHAAMLRAEGRSALPALALAGAKAGFCAGALLVNGWSPPRWRRAAFRGALHVGVVAALLGIRPLQLY